MIEDERKEADPLAEWCAGELNITIDGKVKAIKPTMEHYRKLRKLRQTLQDNGGDVPDDAVKEQTEIFKEILLTTFPNSKLVDDFLDMFEEKFMFALYVAIGWIPKNWEEEVVKKKE